MEKIKVLVVDDHPVVRQGLVPILESFPDIKVIGEAENGRDGLQKARILNPDVIIMDLSMPELGGLETARVLKESLPHIRIVIFSMHEEEVFVHKALSAGAMGYVLKGARVANLAEAVRTVKDGRYYLCDQLNTRVIQTYLKNHKEENDDLTKYDLLSDREQQVFRLMVEGRTTGQIGDLLCVSPKTVEKHRVNVMKKLGLRNPVEMVKYAFRIGLIDQDYWKN